MSKLKGTGGQVNRGRLCDLIVATVGGKSRGSPAKCDVTALIARPPDSHSPFTEAGFLKVGHGTLKRFATNFV